jgi:membrane protein implicated in regulation of membrane protease activity
VHLHDNLFAIVAIYVIAVLRPVPLFCAQTLAHIAVQRRWVLAVYLITVFIALPALVIVLIGVLQTGSRVLRRVHCKPEHLRTRRSEAKGGRSLIVRTAADGRSHEYL